MTTRLTQEEVLRYSRHLLLPDVGLNGQQKLKDASVLIVGTGGLGSPIALYLAAAGVGRIGLVDYDVVDTSNLQRQVIHGTSTVNMEKVASARTRMLDLNPYIQVDIFNEIFNSKNAMRISKNYDILVDGTDNFPTRYLLNDLAVLTGKPYVYGSIFRFDGQISVFDARVGPCYRCLFPEPPPPGLAPSCSEGGVFGVLPGTVGTIQATEVIKLILGIGETLTSKLLLYDALDMSFQTVKLRKNPSCKVCGTSPQITELIDYEDFCGVPTQRGDETSAGSLWDITPPELAEKIKRGDRIQIVDIRHPVELQVSSLPGAVVIPLEQLATRVDELDKTQETVLFCRTGSRAIRGLGILTGAGFTQVRQLRGGINAWANEIDASMLKY